MMTIMKKISIVLVFLLVFLHSNGSALAITSNEEMIRELEAQIVAIQARIKVLKLGVATTSSTEVKKEVIRVRDHDWEDYKLERDLRLGTSGEDVVLLQEILATESSIYPERITTGYFGSLTVEAIKRFQKKHGLSIDATVTGVTKEKLNSFFSERALKMSVVNGIKKYCTDSKFYSVISLKKNSVSNKIEVCPGLVSTKMELSTSATKPTEITVFNGGEHNDTLPDFYYIEAYDVTGVSAKIAVGVTEKVKASVFYAPSTGSISISPMKKSVDEWLKIHSFSLSDLLPGTVYNVYTVVVDGDGKYATSSIKTFKTLSNKDTVAPIISQVRVSDMGTSSVLVSWKTSETSKKKIYYAPTAGFSLDKSSLAKSELYTVVHGLRLENLKAGTLYSFIIESEDVKGNKGKSEVWTFTTAIDDRRPPVFVSIVPVVLSPASAMVTVKSDEATRAMIHFGTSEPIDLRSSYFSASQTLSTIHNFSLNDLMPATNYRFVVSLRDALGNISTSSVGSFRTK